MTVTRRKDTRTRRVLMHKVADIRGGVSVSPTGLGADYLPEGAVLSKPASGVCHVLKTAVLYADMAADATTAKVRKGHLLAKDDIVLAKEGGKASAITAIDTAGSTDYDTLTLGAALGEAVKAGGGLAEAKAASTGTTSELRYEPLAIAGTGSPLAAGHNTDTDAWLIAVTKDSPLPECVAKKLPGIINY